MISLEGSSQRWRCLLDSGASASLIKYDVFKRIKNKPKLEKNKANLQAVDGTLLNVLGRVRLNFKTKGEPVNQYFYVVDGMNRNIILGQDFLVDNGIRVYYDLGCLRIGKTMVPLIPDIHIASVVRNKNQVVVEPFSIALCTGKLKMTHKLKPNKNYVITSGNCKYMNERPELRIIDTVVRVKKTGKTQLMIVNNSGRRYCIRAGTPLGILESGTGLQIASVNTTEQTKIKQPSSQKNT